MINQALHVQAAALSGDAHRRLRVKLPVTDWRVASRLNSMFVAAVEFADACREYPIVFVRAGDGPDGKPALAPVAVFGLGNAENLYLQPDGSWRANYIPALLRTYPFAVGRLDAQSFAICADLSWPGLSETEGERLFDDQGKPTELTETVQKQLEQLETETQRTRLIGQKLTELNLLRDMRFDATMPNGEKVAVDGFMAVEEPRLKALTDKQVLDLQRSGLLGLIHAHLISLGNMRRLVEWRAVRQVAATAAAPTAVQH
jgi:hypothetical protein